MKGRKLKRWIRIQRKIKAITTQFLSCSWDEYLLLNSKLENLLDQRDTLMTEG